MTKSVSSPHFPRSRGLASPLRVLVLEDVVPDAELCLQTLQKAGIEVHADLVRSPEEFTDRLKRNTYDVILADYRLPNWTGMDALRLMKELGRDIPFVLVTGSLGEDTAVECIKQGATDYVLKDRMVRLPAAVERALKEKALQEERTRAEEALRLSEARYREFIENATYGIFRTAAAGRFLEVNPALVRMLGYASKEELLAGDFSAEIYRHPEDRARLLEQYHRMGIIAGAEFEWKRKDGKYISVWLSGRVVPGARADEETLEVIVEDVTERRAMEKHIGQVHKFEAIGQLAGGIAHDFNNVIGAILGWAELGQEQAPADSRIHTHFKKIHEQAHRAAGLTRQLLAFARRQILEPRNINLNLTVADLLSLFENVIGREIKLKIVATPELVGVRADPTQLEQVLMNLCLNARDAMPQGGELRIETCNVEIDQEFCRLHADARPGPYARLTVADTGVGMDASTREHIFEPFFTTKEIGKGTGLGLATVFGIVKQHGGFLEVSSEPGRGSTFHVYLPAAPDRPPRQEKKPEDSDKSVAGGTETILVAEDHESIREMARATLEGLGYRVLLAADGAHALQLFEKYGREIGLVLLDVVMPKVSGQQVYARILADRPDVAVIFATAYSNEVASLTALAEKGVTLLRKPYSPAQLGRKVREALDRVGLTAPGGSPPSRPSAP